MFYRVNDPESVMPERELPRNLRQRLSASLENGARLAAPSPAQARYATLRGVLPPARWRFRALTAVAAAAGIVVVALAGAPESRTWLVNSVNDITRQVVPAGSVTPSPSSEGTITTGQVGSSHKSPEPRELPEATEEPEPAGAPEPAESTGSDEHPQASPTAEPSDDSGGGDRSPEPSPSRGD